MSALFKQPNSPYWNWRERYNGRRFMKSTKMTNKSMAKKIAQQWDMNLMLGDLTFLDLSSNSNQETKSYIKQYIEFLSNRTESTKTLKTAQSHLIRFCDAMNKNKIKRLSQISVKNIDQYIDSLLLAPKTKKNHLQSISSMMKQALKEGTLKSNPCELATLPKIKKNKNIHRPLKPIDLEIIFNGSGIWNLFYLFLYHTGLRANDVACLKYGNIDFKKKSIVSLVRKSRRIHEFPIADVLINALDKNKNEDEHLFPTLYTDNEQNDRIEKPRKWMQSLLSVNDRPHADLHSFRHTFNQSLLDLGMEIEDRQKLLAHASSDTTKVYTHPNFDLAKQYVDKIPKYVDHGSV
jgi:integrase